MLDKWLQRHPTLTVVTVGVTYVSTPTLAGLASWWVAIQAGVYR